eukprot:m.306779 g.306779  ORF g.306779 m.306779 type:complete len:123 (+) comp16354_c0_seq1:2140-2508(+)
MALTICPYKLVLLVITVIFAALVAWNQTNPDQDTDKREGSGDDGEEDVRELTWAEWWETPWFPSVKTNHPVAYRACYTLCVSLLVIFHFEIFTGGFVCRSLFAHDGANATLAAAAAAAGTVN